MLFRGTASSSSPASAVDSGVAPRRPAPKAPPQISSWGVAEGTSVGIDVPDSSGAGSTGAGIGPNFYPSMTSLRLSADGTSLLVPAAAGHLHGRGLMVYGDRTVYEGDWLDDKRHGLGVCFFPSGNVYIGRFVHGEMEGEGSMLYHDGDFFTGFFHRSACHGVGVFFSGGTEIRGEWRNGVRVSVQRRNITTIEEFDGQRLHYETFAAVLRQLHGHFAFYAHFDNRFRVSTDEPFGGVEPAKPSLIGGVAPAGCEESSTAAARSGAPLGGAARSLALPTRGDGAAAQFDSLVSSEVEGEGKSPSSGVPRRPSQFSFSHPQLSSSSFGTMGGLPAADGQVVVQSATAAAATTTTTATLNRKPSKVNRRKRQLSLGDPGHSGGGVLSSPMKDSDGNVLGAGTPPSVALREPVVPMITGGGGGGGGGGGAAELPPQGATPHHHYHGGSALQPLHTSGGGAQQTPQQQLQHQLSLRQHLQQQRSSRVVIFACSTPLPCEYFVMTEYTKHVVLFLFPLFSIPHIPWCPLVLDALDMEREYVVSGAALSHDFKPPQATVYTSLLGLLANVAAIVIASVRTGASSVMGDHVLLVEVVAPSALWLVFAFVCAGNHGFMRVAHALERLDRLLAPKLAAFAANAVDAAAEVCVYTWDEEGRSKVTNSHYKVRWLLASVVCGTCAAFAVPVTRTAMRFGAFLTFGPFHTAVAALSVASIFLFFSGICYVMLKCTDMQRQVLSQLQVLSRLAYLDGVSIMAPSEHRGLRFDLDHPLDTTDFFSGFSGWWVTRAFVLGTGSCSNHASRAACMGAIALCLLVLNMVVIGDTVYAGTTGQLRWGTSHTTSARAGTGPYFTGAHGLALVLVSFGGSLLIRYLTVCLATRQEMSLHHRLMDTVSVFHAVARRDVEASNVISQCRHIAVHQDPMPALASMTIVPPLVLVLTSTTVLAFAVLWVLLADAIYVTHFRV